MTQTRAVLCVFFEMNKKIFVKTTFGKEKGKFSLCCVKSNFS